MKIEKSKKGYCIWLMLVLISLTAGSTSLFGQQKVRLSGRVTDTDGQPVEQATIAVETQRQAVTARQTAAMSLR